MYVRDHVHAKAVKTKAEFLKPLLVSQESCNKSDIRKLAVILSRNQLAMCKWSKENVVWNQLYIKRDEFLFLWPMIF